MSRGWAGGSTRAWRTTRALVLARDGHRCRAHPDGWCAKAGAKPHRCGVYAPLAGGPGVAGHAHHTLGRAVTGDDPRFIVAACAACNLAIGEPGTTPDSAPGPRNPRPRTITQW